MSYEIIITDFEAEVLAEAEAEDEGGRDMAVTTLLSEARELYARDLLAWSRSLDTPVPLPEPDWTGSIYDWANADPFDAWPEEVAR